jgi:signal transduction histidine kinase
LLEERQMQIEEHTEELMSQKEELEVQRDTLFETNATKDKPFSILAHDFRPPFNTIIGYSDMLYKNVRKLPIDKIETRIGYIRDGARNTFELLTNLLDWSRSQQGNIHLEITEFSISELLENELHLLIQQANRKELKLVVEKVGNEKPILADVYLLSTVMRNPISNAIKYSKNGQSIHINSTSY